MITTTWRELLTADDWLLQTRDHVYEIYDYDNTVLYIGKADNAEIRLRAHVGIDSRNGRTRIGSFLHKHRPACYDWKIKIYEPADYAPLFCETFENIRIKDAAPVFNAMLNTSQGDGSRHNPRYDDGFDHNSLIGLTDNLF